MYRDRDNRTTWLHQEVQVPAMADGRILNICRDFLGQSVVMHYADCPENDSRVMLVYAHIRPDSRITAGLTVTKGDLLGTLADTSNRKSGIPCHLHISVMEITNAVDDAQLNWDLFATPVPTGVNIYDPWMF